MGCGGGRTSLEDQGHIWLAPPLDAVARAWLRDTTPADAQFRGDALALESLSILAFADAAREAGMSLEGVP